MDPVSNLIQRRCSVVTLLEQLLRSCQQDLNDIICLFDFWHGKKGICLECNLVLCFICCRIQTLRRCWQTWIAVNCFGYLVVSWRSPWRQRVRTPGKSLASSPAGNLVTVSVRHLHTGGIKTYCPHVCLHINLPWRHRTQGLLRVFWVFLSPSIAVFVIFLFKYLFSFFLSPSFQVL